MPLNERTTRTFHRTLYAGILQTVTLLKRDNDQQMGTVTSFKMFGCRWSKIFKSGEPIFKDILSSHPRTLHIPRIELDRIGIEFITPADRFVDKKNRVWQPESTTTITVKLFENHVCVDCLRVA